MVLRAALSLCCAPGVHSFGVHKRVSVVGRSSEASLYSAANSSSTLKFRALSFVFKRFLVVKTKLAKPIVWRGLKNKPLTVGLPVKCCAVWAAFESPQTTEIAIEF